MKQKIGLTFELLKQNILFRFFSPCSSGKPKNGKATETPLNKENNLLLLKFFYHISSVFFQSSCWKFFSIYYQPYAIFLAFSCEQAVVKCIKMFVFVQWRWLTSQMNFSTVYKIATAILLINMLILLLFITFSMNTIKQSSWGRRIFLKVNSEWEWHGQSCISIVLKQLQFQNCHSS